MFTVGQCYTFEFLDTRDDKGNPDISSSPHREVLAVDGPLVKISDGAAGGHVIVNTNSAVFVRATPSKESSTPGKYRPGRPPGGA